MTVRYASDYEDADELIEELIAAHPTPRSLTLVSSDHRLQRAARRRRAPFVDSDVWFAEALRKRRQDRERGDGQAPDARSDVLSAEEVSNWLAEFESASSDGPHDADQFPPGYGEDVSEN
jgi:hypothetical protein